MAQTLDSYTQFANQFNTAAAERRKRLAESLAQTGQQTFALANPGILEDLNARGLFTSDTARSQAQADALAKISLQNQQQLSDYDTDVFNQGQNILATGMGSDLQRQYDEADRAQEEAMARDLAKQQGRDQMVSSLIGTAGQLGAGYLAGGGNLGNLFGGGGAAASTAARTASAAPAYSSPLNFIGSSSTPAASSGATFGLGAAPAMPNPTAGLGGFSNAGATLPVKTGSTLGRFAQPAGRMLGRGLSIYGGASLGQGLGRNFFGGKGMNDKATSRGVKAGSLIGAGLGSAFGPLGAMAGGALGSAVGGVAGKGVREVSKGVKNAGKSISKSFKKAFCFTADTPITLVDGTSIPIQDIALGQETKGGEVLSMRISLTEDGTLYDYGGVTVTGSHAVLEDGHWVRVENSRQAKPLEGRGIVFSLVTSGHRIFSKGNTFADEHELDEYEELTMEQSLDRLNADLVVA